MKSTLLSGAAVFFFTWILCAQGPSEQPTPAPIYQVTVVERTVQAVNYQYRSEPTKVDLKGTVLLPKADGEAIVQSKTGHTKIDANIQHLEPPTRFGPEYLTYVLWAITPEGHAMNLGELVGDSSSHARLKVTTDLQAFGLIVTAEPYATVHQPSNVVVAENRVRPDTVGQIMPVQAKYELLPRGHYTYNVPSNLKAANAETTKLPLDRYEAVLELYEAQNALQIAKSLEADRYAADTFNRAQSLLDEAQSLQAQKARPERIVTAARAAAEAAEDARAICEKRKADEQLTQAQNQARQQQERLTRVQEELAASRAELEQERAARDLAERQAAAARQQGEASRMQVSPSAVQPRQQVRAQEQDLRLQLRNRLNGVLPTLDTPRGLVVTLGDLNFRDAAVQPAILGSLSRIASALLAQPGLRVEVDGYTDSSGSAERDLRFSQDRAEAVRDALVRAGVPASAIVARGFGKDRALVSNDTLEHRRQNRRVEIVIAGRPIGTLASWDNTYRVAP